MKPVIAIAILALLSPMTSALGASHWNTVGGDAGMTKYSPDNIPGILQPAYIKRFYSTFGNDPEPGNYHYSSSIVIHNGTAVVFSSDKPPIVSSDNFSEGIPFTLFNFGSGNTILGSITPSVAQSANLPLPSGVPYIYATGRYSLRMAESGSEIDSGHYTQAMAWGDDGNLYVRHGGDNAVTEAYIPSTNAWKRLFELKASPTVAKYNSQFEGDANGFLQVYGNQLFYRPGDTRQTSPYVAVDISPAAFASGHPGKFICNIGPDIARSADGFDGGLRYGDIPKAAVVNINGIATPVSVISGLVARSKKTFAVQTQATNLATGKPLWTVSFPSDSGGPTGFYTCTAEYWRFIATADGTYVMYSGTSPRNLQALDMASGAVKWTYTLPAGTSTPLLASHGNDLYVVGKTIQLKLNVDTGEVGWTTHATLQSEMGYFAGMPLNSEDPTYCPMVLTNDTLWFVDGSNSDPAYRDNVTPAQTLFGMSTRDGQIVQRIDLDSLAKRTPGDRFLAVNDMAASDGRLAILLDIGSASDLYPKAKPGSSNGIVYQDLYVFDSAAVPEPSTFSLVAVASLFLLRRGRRLARS